MKKLYLGLVPGIRPYDTPEIAKKMKELDAGIIFSYHTYRKFWDDIIAHGHHNFFEFDRSIMIDSGAYSAFNSGVPLYKEMYVDFLSKLPIEAQDEVVNLDVVGNAKESLDNWNYIRFHLDWLDVMPVIHFPDTTDHNYNVRYMGLGGMVSAFKINQRDSVWDVATWLNKVIKEGIHYHGFGVGSPYHQIAFEELIHSCDWMGWRRNAAICCVYTPEGSRYIPEVRKKKARGKNLSESEFELYKTPFIDEYKELMAFSNRALWNVWMFLTAHEYKESVSKTSYVRSIYKRLHKDKKRDVSKLFRGRKR